MVLTSRKSMKFVKKSQFAKVWKQAHYSQTKHSVDAPYQKSLARSENEWFRCLQNRRHSLNFLRVSFIDSWNVPDSAIGNLSWQLLYEVICEIATCVTGYKSSKTLARSFVLFSLNLSMQVAASESTWKRPGSNAPRPKRAASRNLRPDS